MNFARPVAPVSLPIFGVRGNLSSAALVQFARAGSENFSVDFRRFLSDNLLGKDGTGYM